MTIELVFDDDAFDALILAEREGKETRADMFKPPRTDGRSWNGHWAARGSQECGTMGGYYKHKNNRTSFCRPCREVYNAWRRQENATRRQEGRPRV